MLFLGSLVLLVLLVVYGLPVLFNLTTLISNYKKPPTKISEKTITPTIPRLSEDLTATSSAKIKISGVADPKVTVELFQNDNSLGTVVAKDDGIFSFDVTLTKNNNTVTAQAINDAGQKSGLSEPYQINFLNSPPKLEVSVFQDGVVSGSTDPGVTVSVNDRLIVVESNGKFSYILDLKNGENKIKVVATDQAGNQTTKELTATKATP